MSSICVVKGRIKQATVSSNNKHALPGTLHFSPLTEVYINKNRKNYENAILENRINVVGEHRTGIFRYIKLNLSKIENFEISEILNPSIETIKFIENVGILNFKLNSDEHLKFIEIIEKHKIINANHKLNTLDTSEEIQLLKEHINMMLDSFKYKDLFKIETYLSNEIELISKNRKHKYKLPKQNLLQYFDKYFDTEIQNNLFNTNIENIHPVGSKLFIGPFGMKLFFNEHIYKVSEIYLKKHKI